MKDPHSRARQPAIRACARCGDTGLGRALRASNQLLQPRVLFLELFQALCLVDMEASLLLAPVVVRLLRDPEPAGHLDGGLALCQLDPRLSEPSDDLLRRGRLFAMISPLESSILAI